MATKIFRFVFPVLICLLIGFIASRIQTDSLEYWYPTLNKSPLTPPDNIFGVAWTILYILMGISLGAVLNTVTVQKRFIFNIFAFQLLLNFFWSALFFTYRSPVLALVDILVLDIVVIYYIFRTYPVNRLSSFLFLPYLLWILFATYLNGYIVVNN